MKKLVISVILISNIFAFEGAVVKNLSKFFVRDSIEMVVKRYGSNGAKALERLSAKYGKNGLKKLEEISAKYGYEGIRLVAKYGDDVVKNRAAFEMVEKFGDKGFYLIKRFPKSTEYYFKFGDKFVEIADKFGPSRVMKYLNEAKEYGADGKIIRFLNKFGEKANEFLDRHWGKLLASSFLLLNADDIIKSMENVGEKAVETGGNVAVKSVESIANSDLGIFLGIAAILFVFFKYGWEFIVKLREKNPISKL